MSGHHPDTTGQPPSDRRRDLEYTVSLPPSPASRPASRGGHGEPPTFGGWTGTSECGGLTCRAHDGFQASSAASHTRYPGESPYPACRVNPSVPARPNVPTALRPWPSVIRQVHRRGLSGRGCSMSSSIGAVRISSSRRTSRGHCQGGRTTFPRSPGFSPTRSRPLLEQRRPTSGPCARESDRDIRGRCSSVPVRSCSPLA
jgi:hypothetical protein